MSWVSVSYRSNRMRDLGFVPRIVRMIKQSIDAVEAIVN